MLCNYAEPCSVGLRRVSPRKLSLNFYVNINKYHIHVNTNTDIDICIFLHVSPGCYVMAPWSVECTYYRGTWTLGAVVGRSMRSLSCGTRSLTWMLHLMGVGLIRE